MHFHLPSISFLRLEFLFSAEKECLLPKIKGSMLRGAFGHALKKTVCVMGSEQSCFSCMLRSQCAYARIFESFVEKEPPQFLKGVHTAPRPFVIDAFDPKSTFQPGQCFSFVMILFGDVCEFHPYVIFAMVRAGEHGFTVHRHPFFLEKVQSNGLEIYDGKQKVLLHKLAPKQVANTESLASPVTLHFLTPTRIKQDGKLTLNFTFRRLAFVMLKRHLEMAYFYMSNTQLNWDFKDLLILADKVQFAERKLHWVDWTRYSNRQKTRLDMGGFCGHVALEGDLEPFGPLLRTAEVLHVGKGTVLGMGKMKVEAVDSSSQSTV